MTEDITSGMKVTRPVLFCDGPLEGTWKDVETTTTLVQLPDPSSFEEHDGFDLITYTVEKLSIVFHGAGGPLYVATCQRGSDAGTAILRAVLQRDAAHQLLGDVPKRLRP